MYDKDSRRYKIVSITRMVPEGPLSSGITSRK